MLTGPFLLQMQGYTGDVSLAQSPTHDGHMKQKQG
jgi:hypothetical protein